MSNKVNGVLKPLSYYKKFSKHTPCFLFEKRPLDFRTKEYMNAIKKSIIPIKPYYAMKSNCYLPLLICLVRQGLGLDASSRRELQLAKKAGAQKIIFTGPGKSQEDMEFAVNNFKDPVIHLDSFYELQKLKKIKTKNKIRICVRIYTERHGGWKKFGIPLERLKEFYLAAQKLKNIDFQGIHFHNSWNKDATPYIDTLKEIENVLKNQFSIDEQKDFKIIDIGGGLYCDRVEGEFITEKSNKNFFDRLKGYRLIQAIGIDKFVSDLNKYFKSSLYFRIPGFAIMTEPGRWLCNHCMQILLKVIDIKDEKLAILDGGTENFGYVSKEEYYYPIYNLTHPGKKEKKIVLAGRLCAADDIWGYYCYASQLAVGDILLIPVQGAYTYSYAKDFIQPFPSVHEI